MKVAQWSPMRDIRELKALMIRNQTEEYLHFKKVDQGKLKDVTKKVNAVMAVALWVSKEFGEKKDKIG